MKARKLVAFIVISLAALQFVQAQSGLVNRADKHFNNFNFSKAAETYQKVLEKDPTNVSAKEKAAKSYMLISDYANAESLYAQLVKLPNAKPIYKYKYAQALSANGKYDEANPYFIEYSRLRPSDSRGNANANLKSIKSLAGENGAYNVKVLDINTAGSDFSPSFTKEGIVFASNGDFGNSKTCTSCKRMDGWTGKKFYDLYEAKGECGTLSNVSKLEGKNPNGKFHEGPVTFNPAGNEMFFTRNNYTSSASKSADGIIKLKVFKSTNKDGEWSDIVELPFNSDEYSCAHPTMSKDGKRLYFASDMPGGMGGTDIYVSYQEGNSWGSPINLGKEVNTAGDELFPFVADNGTLYFSSNGHIGLGGLDVMSASYSGGKWGSVSNIGAPVNSHMDDFGYIVNKEDDCGYFTSNRPGGMGNDDIYHFTKEGMLITGQVVDSRTKQPIPGCNVTLTTPEGNVTIPTDADAKFKYNAKLNTNYSVSSECSEYNPNMNNSFKTPAVAQDLNIQIPMTPEAGLDLVVEVVDKNNSPLLGSNVILTNLNTNEEFTCQTDASGKCAFSLEENTDYKIFASKVAGPNEACEDAETTVSTRGKVAPASLFSQLRIRCFVEDEIIEIPDIYYDYDKSFIRPDAAARLDQDVMPILTKYPSMVVELRSHTDSRGSDSYNQSLSQRRAQAAVDYLISRGISRNRLVAGGYGEGELKNRCANGVRCSDDEHQANRRTEFKIIKIR